MKTDKRSSADIPLTIRNDAAAWIMQLHAADRAPNVDAALRAWLAQNPMHRHAFEMASDMWAAGATLPVSTVARIGRTNARERSTWQRAWPLAAAAAVAIAIAMATAMGGFNLFSERALTTSVGEQRTLSLEDGTRVTLNTATRLTVSFNEGARRVTLDAGEALFEVAHQPDRPFVVDVADHYVTALGTSFVVRHEPSRTTVTLVEGKVSVSPAESPTAEVAGPAATVLQPGDRLTLADHARPQLDRPEIDKVTAWKRGQAAFQNTPLPDAIEEMNRYSEKKLVIGDATAAAVRVSGIFRVGESSAFAMALLSTYPLRSSERGDSIVIYGGALPEAAR